MSEPLSTLSDVAADEAASRRDQWLSELERELQPLAADYQLTRDVEEDSPAGKLSVLRGWTEGLALEVSYDEDRKQLALALEPGSKLEQTTTMGIILGGVLIGGLIADANPQLLPVLRGVRVLCGAVAGLIAAVPLLLVAQAVLGSVCGPANKELAGRVRSLVAG